MIRVLIADDHAILRRGLKQILAETEDMTVAGEAENSQQALQLVREAEWDVVLLDISMPDRNGIDTLKLIKKEKPKLAVLMLSMHPENQYAIRALQAGASVYLTKQSAPAQLVTAIRQVKQGRKYVSPTLAEQLAARLGGGGGDGETASHEALSHREYQTLTLLSSGKTLSEVAAELKLSVKTVSVYRSRLLEKLQLKNNAELTHYAIKNGLVE
jgi:DNA-binding NarL/FixJ family response regulator